MSIIHTKLIEDAQRGDEASLERLSAAARERLGVDVYRLTMDHHLADEIVQEAIVEMLKILNELKEADRFWPWLWQIALNKFRLHKRKERVRKSAAEAAAVNGAVRSDARDAISETVGRELKDIVLGAMEKLKAEHRAIITMRCYREMDYSTIAEAMGCSTFAAKMLFFRAKKSLKRQLVREGFGKGSLLMALILFGKATSPAEAAGLTVGPSTVKVGAVAGTVGLITGKAAIVSITTAGVIGVGAAVGPPIDGYILPWERDSNSVTWEVPPVEEAAQRVWCYRPADPDGPVLMRIDQGRVCVVLQNEEGNYRYDQLSGQVALVNARYWLDDLGEMDLPAGEANMMVVEDSADGGQMHRTEYPHAMKDEYFQPSWGPKVVDQRDEMHRRGWAYFTVEGQIDGKAVSGEGRLPFVLSAVGEHWPWLELRRGGKKWIVDMADEALEYGADGKVSASYAAGSFFAGLGRPWIGLHTIDIVRRDAGASGMECESEYVDGDKKRARVTVTGGDMQIEYVIDMEKDVVDSIAFGDKGQLRFEYQQGARGGIRFEEPWETRRYRSLRRATPGVEWMLRLVERTTD